MAGLPAEAAAAASGPGAGMGAPAGCCARAAADPAAYKAIKQILIMLFKWPPSGAPREVPLGVPPAPRPGQPSVPSPVGVPMPVSL